MEFKLLKCEICGKMVAVLKDTPVPTICCGQPMKVLNANTGDGAYEKHVP
ncbi:MAG: desulfoferrodoxin, partial [Bacilli bacterium]|nr:desulfoferrodoxin [Bacilli bacterium]